MASTMEEDQSLVKKQLPLEPIPIKPTEGYKHTEEPFQSGYVPSKSMSHSPKISPSSIPNPNPSVISTKSTEPTYPTIGGYPYSIPGFSAFQPVSYPSQISPSFVEQTTPSQDASQLQSDVAQYSIDPSDPIPTSMSPQGSHQILPSILSMSSMPLASTLTSVPPITTAASMGSLPQITSVLSLPPMSTMASESSVPSMPHPHSIAQSGPTQKPGSSTSITLPEFVQRVALEPTVSLTQSEPSINRMSLEHSMSTPAMNPMLSTIRLQSEPPASQVITSMPMSELSMQRMAVQHTMAAIAAAESDHSMQRNVASMLKLPSESSIQRMALEPSIPANPMLPETSAERVPLEHSMSTIPSQLSMQRSALESSTSTVPAIPSDLLMQGIPLEYSMSDMSMLPSELLMRRMQLLQSMQSMQGMPVEQIIPSMPQTPLVQASSSIPQAQSMTSINPTIAQPTTTMATITTEPSLTPMAPRPDRQTSMIPQSQSMVSMPDRQHMQSTSLMPQSQSMTFNPATQLQSTPPNISSEIAMASMAYIPQTQIMSSTTSTTQIPSLISIQSNPLQSLPQQSGLSSEPLSTTMHRIQTAQPMPQTSAMLIEPPETSRQHIQVMQTVPYSLAMSSEASIVAMQRMQLLQSMASMSTPSDHSKSQIPVVQLESQLPVSSSEQLLTSMQQIQNGQSALNIASDNVTAMSTELAMQRMLLIQRMASMSEKLRDTSVASMPHMQTAIPSELALQRMHLLQSLQSMTNMASTNSMLSTESSTVLAPNTVAQIQSLPTQPSIQPGQSMPSMISMSQGKPMPIMSSMSQGQSMSTTPSVIKGQSMPSMVLISKSPSMPPMASISQGQSIPELSTTTSEQSMQRIQFIQPMHSAPNMPSDRSMIPIPHTQTSILTDPSMQKMHLSQTMPATSTVASVPSMASLQQIQSAMASIPNMQTALASIQTAMASEILMQRMQLAQSMQSASTTILDKSMPQAQIAVPAQQNLQRMNVVQPMPYMTTLPSEKSMSSMSHLQSENTSESSLQRMALVQPLLSNSNVSSAMSIPHITQAMPQVSAMSSEPAASSMQRIQLVQPMPSISTMPSEPYRESMPPITRGPLIVSATPTTDVYSMPSTQVVSESSSSTIKSLSSEPHTHSMTLMPLEPSISAVRTEQTAPQMQSVATSPQLQIDEMDAQSEVVSIIVVDDQSLPEMPQAQYQTDFEDQLAPEVILTQANSEDVESSITQGLGAMISPQTVTKEIKRKPLERFSLKTSIPISKIDMKCVPNPPDAIFQNSLTKTPTYNTSLKTSKTDSGRRIEIQSNIIVKPAAVESEFDELQSMVPSPHSNLTTLISAAEAININENQFKRSEHKVDVIKESNPFASQESNMDSGNCSTFITRNIDSNNSKVFQSSVKDGSFSEQKNQIVFIQNKSSINKKALTIIKENPKVLLHRNTLENKQQTSSRFGINKCKKDPVLITDHIPSKVVALKRLHQGNCDEDDFENLITENQIYGNKIVVKEKLQGTSQEQDIKIEKNKINKTIQSETKSVVKKPNFVYLSNVKFPDNLVMYKNNSKPNPDINKDNKICYNENKAIETNNKCNNVSESAIKTKKVSNICKENTKSSNNSLQAVSNKSTKTDILIQTTNQKVGKNQKNLHQAESNIKGNELLFNLTPIRRNVNKDVPKSVEQNQWKENSFLTSSNQTDLKTYKKSIEINTTQGEEVSSLDLYEKRKRMRRLKYLSSRDIKDVQKPETKKCPSNGRYIITPEKVKAEIYKEFASTRLNIDHEGCDMESDYEEDELKEYESVINTFGPNATKIVELEKAEFLSNFMLGTLNACEEILWSKKERAIGRDRVASAYIAAGRLDRLMNEEAPRESTTQPKTVILNTITHEELNNNGNFQSKQTFLSELDLAHVTPQHREGYEQTWQEVINERKRRDAPKQSNHIFKQPRIQPEKAKINTNSELQMLTEIQNCVTENNNLIKKRLDLSCENEGDSIKILAEKNFSELDRLSKMADRSVKHFSGQDMKKRDLNPGFDSENIQKPKPDPNINPPINYPSINIPSISKIISLKTTSEPCTATTTQATSMDEPQNSAAGANEIFSEANLNKSKDIGCQTEKPTWPGVEEMIRMYRDFERVRKREVIELNRRNTSLKVEGAHITRAASRDSDRARALLAERRHLAAEETAVQQAIQRLFSAVDIVRNYF